MPTPLLGAGIAGISSLASSLIGNAGSKKAQSRANAYNLEMWNRQNQYNHPVQQMARLKQAGLNPNLVYGGGVSGAAGMADKITPAKAPDYKMDNPLNSINQFANLKQTSAQTDNVKSQTDVNIQEALLKSEQTAKIISETSQNKFDLNLAKELRSTSADLVRENLRKMQAQSSEAMIDVYIKDRNKANLIKEVKARVDLLKANKLNVEASTEIRNLEAQLKDSGMENAPAWLRILFKNYDEFKKKTNIKIKNNQNSGWR